MALNGCMASRRPSGYRTLASLSRINLLNELQQHGSRTVAELARAIGLHHNTAREHLHRLIDAGLVESESIRSHRKGRPRILYRMVRRVDSPRKAWLESLEQKAARGRKLLPIVEASGDRTESRQLDALDNHMDRCGFEVEIQQDQNRMLMHECPFGDLAKENPQVCQVHFELVKDVLELADGPLQATEVHPFLKPNLCAVEWARQQSDDD